MMAEQVFDRYIENADKVMDLSYAMLEKHIADQEELPDNTDVIRRKQGEIEKLMNKRTNLIEILLQHLAIFHPQQRGDLLPILRWSRGRHCQNRGV